MLFLTIFIALIGICYLGLAMFITYKNTVKVPRKPSRKRPHKKVPDKYPGEEDSKVSK